MAQSVKILPTMQETTYNARDIGLIPGLSPGEGNSNPLQYSCLENPLDRGVWWAIIHGLVRVRHDLVTKPPPHIQPIIQANVFHQPNQIAGHRSTLACCPITIFLAPNTRVRTTENSALILSPAHPGGALHRSADRPGLEFLGGMGELDCTPRQ